MYGPHGGMFRKLDFVLYECDATLVASFVVWIWKYPLVTLPSGRKKAHGWMFFYVRISSLFASFVKT